MESSAGSFLAPTLLRQITIASFRNQIELVRRGTWVAVGRAEVDGAGSS